MISLQSSTEVKAAEDSVSSSWRA